MAKLSELDVINECLATMGEAPLNEVDASHPYVPPAQTSLMRATNSELGKGWWFNTDYGTILPDPITGELIFPGEAITMQFAGNAYTQRGRRIWDRANQTYNIGKTVPYVAIMDIPFDDLPTMANELVGARAVLEFQAKYDSDDTKYKKLLDRYNQLFLVIKAEDIRQRKVNVFNGWPGGKLSQVRPMSVYTSGRNNFN